MKILKLRCQASGELGEVFKTGDAGTTVFCPTTEETTEGSEVVVEVISKLLPNRVLIKGRVQSWRPALPRMRVRAGATVLLDPREANKIDFVIQTIAGLRPPAPRRRHARLPVALPVTVCLDAGSTRQPAEVREISVVGALLGGIPLPPVGSELVLRLTPPGGEAPMDISCRVLYHAGTDGLGVRFQFREGGGSRRLRELVRRLKND